MSAKDIDRDAIAQSLRAAGARFALLHGSRVAGTAREGSDVDVAAHFGGRNPAAWEIDVPRGVDLAVLDSVPLELAGRVALHGELLFDDDPPLRVEWQAQTRLMYFDEETGRSRGIGSSWKGAAVVDERRVPLLLQRISEDLEYLTSGTALDREALRADVDRLAAVKYYLVTAIEGCLGVAQHLCASEGWGPPSDNADAMRLLGAHRMLEEDLAASLASAVRFRNLLVHEYARIDDERVAAYLDRLNELKAFVASVAAWMDRKG